MRSAAPRRIVLFSFALVLNACWYTAITSKSAGQEVWNFCDGDKISKQRQFKSLCRPQSPPGDMLPRVPSESWQMYYYDRPYNAHQAADRFWSGSQIQGRSLHPYSRQIFKEAYLQIERSLGQGQYPGADYADKSYVLKDKYLEYSDWKKFRVSRQRFEHAELEKESTKGQFQNASTRKLNE